MLYIFNSQLRGLYHCTQIGEKPMSLNGMWRTFDVGHVVVAKVIWLIPAKDIALFYINTKVSAVFNSTTMKSATTLKEEKIDTKNS